MDARFSGYAWARQMLALAFGGNVEPSRSGGELGLRKIDLNDESWKDPLFAGMESPAEAVQWHDDEITELPRRAVLLASSGTCRVQAFRMGERSWGVQFHPEASGAVMQAWADSGRAPRLPPARLKAVELAVAEVSGAEERLFDQWQGFAERFARIVKEDNSARAPALRGRNMVPGRAGTMPAISPSTGEGFASVAVADLADVDRGRRGGQGRVPGVGRQVSVREGGLLRKSCRRHRRSARRPRICAQ